MDAAVDLTDGLQGGVLNVLISVVEGLDQLGQGFVRAGNAGAIIQRITDNGFKLRALKLIHMSKPVAEGFYAVHRARPFFGELVEFMTSGPSVVLALEKENAQPAWRDLMGPTDATKAPKGTIRGDFGTSMGENATHGSDSPENAQIELSYFFNATEFC